MVDHIYLTTSHHSFILRLQTSPIGSGTEIGAGSMIHEKENETKTGFYFFFTVGFRFFGHCDTVWICLNTIKFGSSVLADWWSHMSSFILADLERIQTRCWTLSPTTRSIPRLNLLSIFSVETCLVVFWCRVAKRWHRWSRRWKLQRRPRKVPSCSSGRQMHSECIRTFAKSLHVPSSIYIYSIIVYKHTYKNIWIYIYI